MVNGPEKGDAKKFPVRVCDLRVPNGIIGYAEGEANARLLASAPELLEALQAMVWLANDREWEDPSPEITQARAAIAKATGEKS
jgi:hypothetical protein